MTTRRVFASGVPALLSLLLIASACDDRRPSPTAPGAGQGAGVTGSVAAGMSGPDRAPFYWYRDTKILLEAVPGEYVVRATAADPAGAARAALSELKLDVEAGRSLIRGHRVLRVPGAGRGAARAVARRLHDHPGIPFAAPRYELRNSGEPFVPLGTFMVRFRDGASPSGIEALNAEFGVTVVRAPEPGKPWQYHHLRYPASGERDVLEVAAAYHRHPLTEWADPSRLVRVEFFGAQTGTMQEFFVQQWYLENQFMEQADGVPLDINVVPAWEGGHTGAGVEVAILDSGVDGDHEDLGAVLDGGDFFEDSQCQDPSDPACEEIGATNPDTGDFHGTAVAGIVAAQHQDDGLGVAGIAPDVELYSVRIGNFDDNNLAPVDSLAAAIQHATFGLRVDVINGSWGTGFQAMNAISDALEWAVKDGRGGKGIVSVFSAGNDGDSVAFPARDPNAVAVSGLAGNEGGGDLHALSNFGPEIEVAAFWGDGGGCPGGEIVTTDPMGTAGCDANPDGNGNYSSSFSGTSAAAPQVAGAVALLLEKYPGLTFDEVRTRIAMNSDLGDTGFWDDPDQFGAGKLNVGALLDYTEATDGSGGGCSPEQVIC